MELLGWIVFHGANVYVLIDWLRFSSDLSMVWITHVPQVLLLAAVWGIGTCYLWFRSSNHRLPRYWYAALLVWLLGLLAIVTDVPQIVRFRQAGDEAFDAYLAANPAGPVPRIVETEIGGYQVQAVQELDGVYVFHIAPKDDWLADHAECAAVMHVEPDDVGDWWPAHPGGRSRHLGGDWWLLNFEARGVWCPAHYEGYVEQHAAD